MVGEQGQLCHHFESWLLDPAGAERQSHCPSHGGVVSGKSVYSAPFEDRSLATERRLWWPEGRRMLTRRPENDILAVICLCRLLFVDGGVGVAQQGLARVYLLWIVVLGVVLFRDIDRFPFLQKKRKLFIRPLSSRSLALYLSGPPLRQPL